MISTPHASTSALDRTAFALDPAVTYLNNAAVGVLPAVTRDALHAFVDGHARRGVLGVAGIENAMPQYRAAVAAYIGADAGEIAILRNTGDGATILAQGYDWQPGDQIVINRNEFGSNAFPWLALRARGVEIVFVDAPRERMTPQTLAARMTPRTRAVALSWVTFDDGYRHDVAALAEVAHRAGALVFVDAIQGLGAFEIDVHALGIDALYAGGAKWLLALQGVSLLYVRRELMDRLNVALPGWRSVADMWDFLDYDQAWVADASRYEGGTPNFAGALSLATSIGVLRSAPRGEIGAHVIALTDRLVDGLRRRAAIVDSVRSATESSGIVRFRLPGVDLLAVGRRLADAGIVTTNRATSIRVAPHGYNTAAEIDHLLDSLPR